MKGPASRKEEPLQKVMTRIEYEPKVCKAKRMMMLSTGPTTFDEAKATCKARKRKERQESISSHCQERKVIRSNSEERPVQKKIVENKNNIRRVCSSGDFPKSASFEKINVSPNRMMASEKIMTYEDFEHERRRSHERFARPLTMKNKKFPNKRIKIRYMAKTKYKPELPTEKEHWRKTSQGNHDGHKLISESIQSENENKPLSNILLFQDLERERCPSPVEDPVSPALDFSTLHEQVDCSEPLLSCPNRQLSDDTETLPGLSVASNRLLSSPRNSIIATHRIYLDPDVPQLDVSLEKLPQNPVVERMQKLSKQINSLKKKIKNYELAFESENGFKPSHIDKLNDRTMKKLYADLSKLKKEQKQLSDVSTSCSLLDLCRKSSDVEKNSVNLKETIKEIEQKLSQKREAANRCYNLEEMTSEQLMDEKIAMQKALLYLESVHGRPSGREDRDIVRPFYDRYRTLKRINSKISAVHLVMFFQVHHF